MDQFLEALREFKAAGGNGVVYGGCLRDSYCGVGPIKDIDIAVEDTPNNRAAVQRFVDARREAETYDPLFGYPTSSIAVPLIYGNFPDVIESVTVTTEAQIPINFVVLAFGRPFTKQLVAERCDFGICQIALDFDGVYCTEAFSRDFSRRTFTYLREPFDQAQLDRSKRRFERFLEKYPEWTMVVPEFIAPPAGVIPT